MEERFYTCPMHPNVRERLSGKCPICGMDLVLEEAGQRPELKKIALPRPKLSDFIPLIAMFGIIITFTVGMLATKGSFDPVFAICMFEGAFFITFGGAKMLQWKDFMEGFRIYDIIAKRSKIYAWSYPAIEVVLGILYLSGSFLREAAVATFVIMGIGAIGVLLALRKHEEIYCVCLGAVFKIPMTYVTLLEDILMMLMAGFMFWLLV